MQAQRRGCLCGWVFVVIFQRTFLSVFERWRSRRPVTATTPSAGGQRPHCCRGPHPFASGLTDDSGLRRRGAEHLPTKSARSTGRLARQVEQQRRRIIDLEATIADMQAPALETALAAPPARPKRARAPRRRKRPHCRRWMIAQLAELHRIVAAIDVRCDRLERLLTRFIAVLEARERPPQPPAVPMH